MLKCLLVGSEKEAISKNHFSLLFCLLCGQTAMATEAVIRIATPQVPHVIYFSEGKGAGGVLYEYWSNVIVKKSKVQFEWQPSALPLRAYKAIEENKLDAIFIWSENSRIKTNDLVPSQEIVISFTETLIVRKLYSKKKKMIVAIQSGVEAPKELQDDGDIIFEKVYGEMGSERLIQLLLSKRVDAIYNNVPVSTLIEIAKMNKLTQVELRVLKNSPKRNFVLGFSPRVSLKTREAIDKALHESNKTKIFSKMLYEECFKYAGKECEPLFSAL